jgi:hypothetical protein
MSTPIPAAALAHHIAILGKTGSGKSNAAKTIVEGLLDAGERICVLDPTGAWWGLRLRADGKPSPYPVVIFGGLHADVQIAAAHGAAIAEVIATSSTPAVIDTRLMTVSDRTAFFTGFAQTLLRKNRGPLHLVIDEAHLFAPQGRVADPRSGEMLHAANNLVSLGRSIGLRITMLSQRPAKLHKDSLTQVETLVAMRLIAPQDRAAIEAWIGEWAEPGRGREIVNSLASLPTGDAWVWSPEISYLERVHFPLAGTYDSGKAPSSGEAGPALGAIDLDAVNARLETVAADVKSNDPRTLKAEVARLTAELAKAGQGMDARIMQKAVEAADRQGYDRGLAEGEARGVAMGIARARSALDALAADPAPADATPRKPAPAAPERPQRQPSPAPERRPSRGNAAPALRLVEDDIALTAPQARVLEALAFWRGLDIAWPTRTQVAAAAGYSPSSGGFANLLGTLRTAGLVDYPATGCVSLTANGRARAGDGDVRPLLDRVHSILSAPQIRVLTAILAAGEISRDELARATDYSATSGGFANLLGSLRSLGFVDYPARGQVRAAEWLR